MSVNTAVKNCYYLHMLQSESPLTLLTAVNFFLQMQIYGPSPIVFCGTPSI